MNTKYKHSFSGHWKYPHIHVEKDLKNVRYIYRYMSWRIFIKCISNETIRFVEPSKWPDKFESLFYCANYHFNNNDNNIIPPKVYALCTTRERDCEPSWLRYASGGMTIQIKINRQEWLKSLNQWRKNSKDASFDVYEGSINYDLNEAHIVLLPQPTYSDKNKKIHQTKGYKELFSNFDFNSYLSLLLLKRKAYSYEKEIRYFLISRAKEAQKDDYIEPEAVFSTDIIEEIRYSPDLPKCRFCIMLQALRRKGWKIVSQNNKKTIAERNGRQISILSFDINEGTYIDINKPLDIKI